MHNVSVAHRQHATVDMLQMDYNTIIWSASKSVGPNEIPTWILKEYAKLIAPILKVIYTESYQTSILPSDWLTANIVPVYKKGDKSIPANYRPISLTSVCRKTMHGAYNLSLHNGPSQYIRSSTRYSMALDLDSAGLSCQTQLILLIEEILRAMDQNYQVDLRNNVKLFKGF